MTDTFLKKIRNLGNTEKNKIKDILEQSHYQAVITSMFEIPAEQQQIITTEISNVMGEKLEIQYISPHDHICGIDFRVKNYRIGWNLDDYIKFLEKEVDKTLDEELAR